MKRSIAFYLCLAFAMAADTLLAERDETDLPNIVLMMADDLGWGDVGYNGHPDLETRNLDAMSKSGLRFNRFYAAAPVCSPTRGSCVTGRHPFRYGIYTANAGHMRAEELTLAELLQHGYATGHFGKWHMGTLSKTVIESNRGGPNGIANYSPPWENGFEVSFSTEAKVPTWDPLLRPLDNKSRTWWDPVENESDAVAYGTNYWSNGELAKENLRGDSTSRVIMDRAIPFIRGSVKAKKPFFAIVWYHAPHLPVVAGPEYATLYEDFDKYTQHYYGCITALDEQVGRLRNELRELDIAQNTLVCFCSDNGPEGSPKAPGSAKDLRGRKRSLFEGGVRVPGIIEWPARIKPGTETDIPATTTDYLPTILDALGAKIGDERPIDGVSLLPLFAGKMTERPKPIGFQSSGQMSLVDNRYKIIHQPTKKKGRKKQHDEPKSLEFMLFDLVNDASETIDIAKDKPEIAAKMIETLLAWRESCKASDAGGDYE